jgi:signal peptidase I
MTQPKDAKAEPAAQPAPKKTARRATWEWIKSLAVALVIWFVLRSLVVEAFRIPSSSMERTLLVGDFLFVNKALYGAEIPLTHVHLPALRQPRRGDIVVFDSQTERGVKVVKRLVGMPGDTLQMIHAVLYRDGVPQREPYVEHTDSLEDPSDAGMRPWQAPHLLSKVNRARYEPTRDNWGPLVVSPDSFFVMGDNRDNSYDSRYWGFVPRGVVRGRPMFVYYSYDHDSWKALPFLTAIRWSRIGHRPR